MFLCGETMFIRFKRCSPWLSSSVFSQLTAVLINSHKVLALRNDLHRTLRANTGRFSIMLTPVDPLQHQVVFLNDQQEEFWHFQPFGLS